MGDELLENSLNGFNNTLFAYGQTGSGKTHTVTGPPDDRGLIPRMIKGENFMSQDFMVKYKFSSLKKDFKFFYKFKPDI